MESVPNRNSPPAILLRESFRQDGRVCKRTIANLSSWPPPRLEALRRSLRGDFDHLAADPVSGPVFGLLSTLKNVADQLGLSAALGKSRLAKLALFLVLARVAHQGSRLSAVRWAQDHAVAEILGLSAFDEDDLYAAFDDLCARQEAIEQSLFCCLLALNLSRELERRLQAAIGTTDANPHALTLPDALAALSRLCLLHHQIDAETTLTRLPQPDARQSEILQALRVALPKK